MFGRLIFFKRLKKKRNAKVEINILYKSSILSPANSQCVASTKNAMATMLYVIVFKHTFSNIVY